MRGFRSLTARSAAPSATCFGASRTSSAAAPVRLPTSPLRPMVQAPVVKLAPERQSESGQN
jgi:hypothetical protein